MAYGDPCVTDQELINYFEEECFSRQMEEIEEYLEANQEKKTTKNKQNEDGSYDGEDCTIDDHQKEIEREVNQRCSSTFSNSDEISEILSFEDSVSDKSKNLVKVGDIILNKNEESSDIDVYSSQSSKNKDLEDEFASTSPETKPKSKQRKGKVSANLGRIDSV